MALTYLNSKMIEEPANFDQLYVISLTALSSTVQNTLTNDLTAINVTGDSVIDVDTPGNALRVTQRGIGNALLVEDSQNPDSTPFVINSLGRVGIGVSSPTTELDVNGTIKGNTILGTNVNVTNTGTFQTVDTTNVTTQNLILPTNGSGGIINNATFYGNLSVLGTISFLSGGTTTATTLLQQTSSLSIINSNSDVALFVSQGPNLSGVATFIGSGTEVLKVNNPNPNPNNLPAVVVNGVLSASGGNSTNWNNTFTNVQSNSANYVLQGGNTLAADLSVGTANARNLVLETNNIERMRIDIAGNVGIGTTSPNARVHAEGSEFVAFKAKTTSADSNAALVLENDARDWRIQCQGFDSDKLYFYDGVAAATRMVIDTSGNVGIGTNSPLARLHVAGTNAFRISGGSGDYIATQLANTSGVELQVFANANLGAGLLVTTNHPIDLATNNTTRMRIDASGNVGIGTGSPQRRLQTTVMATPTATQAAKTGLLIQNGDTTGTSGSPNSALIQFAFDPASPRGYIESGTFGLDFMAFGMDGTERMRIDSSGNVGIGTSSPTQKLHAVGNALITLGTWGTSGEPTLYLGDTNNYISTAFGGATNLCSYNALRFITGVTPAERLRIDASGNVGIGTASPATRLHVDGTIRYTNRPAAGTITAIGFDANGDLRASSSSLRYKNNIQPYTKGLSAIGLLEPVTFNYNGEQIINAGLIVEDLEQQGFEEFVLRDSDGRPDAIPYGNIVALLINGIQELTASVQELKALTQTQSATISALENRIQTLETQ